MSISDAAVYLVGAATAYMLFLLKTAAKTTAEETAKAVIQQLVWPEELARELQKSRGVERQELRFKSYGALWKELRPLAIYDSTMINKATVTNLSSNLSDWYFSECGGLLLTPQARDFYFALQDLLRATSKSSEDWEAHRPEQSEGSVEDIFKAVLKARKANGAIDALNYVSPDVPDDWQKKAAVHAKEWRDGIKVIAGAWNDLDKGQRFATLQQVGSLLRTTLTIDLESRIR